MTRPFASPTVAPTALARRLVLGTALLLGLAFALAPRIPVAWAQDSSAAPSTGAKPAPPPASKTVTITDGRGGVSAKIEVTESPHPAAKAAQAAGEPAAAGDPAAGEADTVAPSRHGGVLGRHGRVRIEGIGSDREFDSFGDFVHDEPAIAIMVVAVVAVVFLAPVLAIGLILWYRFRKNRMLNETMLKLAEKGVVAPAEALQALAGGKQAAALSTGVGTAPIYEQAKQIRRRAAWSDLRKGVITGGIGLALTLYSLFDDRSPNGLGLILLFVGIGFVVLWWFEERQLAPADGIAPDGGTSGPSSRSSPGGAPPSA
jgi:hypothetical protein